MGWLLQAGQVGSAAARAPLPAANIGTPVDIGTNSVTTGVSTTLAITTTATAAVGKLVCVAITTGGSTTISSVVDSAGNTWVAGTSFAFSSNKLAFWWSFITTQLASGGTITITYAVNTGKKYAAAFMCSGLSGSDLDSGAAGATGASTVPTITTATLGTANELLIGAVLVLTGNADTYTEDAGNGWTTLNSIGLSAGDKLHVAYQIVAATTAKTYAPTLGTSRTWGEGYHTFNA